MEVLELPNKSEKIIDFAWEPKVSFQFANLCPAPYPLMPIRCAH